MCGAKIGKRKKTRNKTEAKKCLYTGYLKQAVYDTLLSIIIENIQFSNPIRISECITLNKLYEIKAQDIDTSYFNNKAAADFLSNIANAATNRVREC